MTDFKPSTLPIDTVIEDEEGDQWTKDSHTTWVSDSVDRGRVDDSFADEYIKEFKIISVPWHVVVLMALKLQDEYGTVDSEGEDITIFGLIKEALDESARQDKFEQVVTKSEKEKS